MQINRVDQALVELCHCFSSVAKKQLNWLLLFYVIDLGDLLSCVRIRSELLPLRKKSSISAISYRREYWLSLQLKSIFLI